MEKLSLEKFNPNKEKLEELKKECSKLKIKGIDDKIGYNLVHTKRMDLADIRINITKTGKELRQEALKFQKDVISYERELIAIIEPTEIELKAKEKAIDNEKEKIKRVELLPERKEKLENIDVSISDNDILEMDNKQFDEFYNEKNAEYLEEKQAKIDEENIKIENEKKILKEKKDRIKFEEQAKIDADKKAQEEIERIKLQEKQKIEDEQKKLEADKEYNNFLKDNGYTEENKDNFYIMKDDNKIILYKKVNELIIK